MAKSALIRIYEHHSLRVDDVVDGVAFTDAHRAALEAYCGKGTPYFSLIHRGVKFNEHVGVLQAGTLTIEVLPKADYDNRGEGDGAQKSRW